MQLTGHKTRSVFERYNIVSAGDLRDAARRLDEARGHTWAHQRENGCLGARQSPRKLLM
jgi:hypothetical protein